MNFEGYNQQFERGLDFDRKVEAVLDLGFKERLQVDDFSDIYSKEEIRRDKEQVETYEEHFESQLNEGLDREDVARIRKNQKRGEALEILLGSQVEANDWLGSNALVVRTTKYDDIRNGIDAVVEFENDPDNGEEVFAERLALNVDATMNVDRFKIREKIERNIRKLQNEESPSIKYFKSQVDDTKGELKMIVPVVIGLGGKNANELIGLLGEKLLLREQRKKLSKEKSSEKRISDVKEQIKEKNKLMAEHPAQIIFIKEVVAQLEMYLDLFKDKTGEVAESYNKQIGDLLETVEAVLDEKNENGIETGELEDDSVYRAIMETTDKTIK